MANTNMGELSTLGRCQIYNESSSGSGNARRGTAVALIETVMLGASSISIELKREALAAQLLDAGAQVICLDGTIETPVRFAIAAREGLTDRHVARLLDLALLPPTLVEEIMQGRQRRS